MEQEKSCVGCVHYNGSAVVVFGNEPCWACLHNREDLPNWDEKPNWNYCPNCGADMRKEEP